MDLLKSIVDFFPIMDASILLIMMLNPVKVSQL